MPDSTPTPADYQYLRAFRQLFPTRLLQQAVAATGRPTRTRKLPLHLLLGMLITWFFKPDHGLPSFIRWLLHSRRDGLSEPAVYKARGRLGWAPLRWLRRRVLRPLADPKLDPDAFYRGRRLFALDGSTFTVADSPANERSFGRARNQHRASGYPL